MLEPEEEYMLAKRWKEHEDPEAAHRLVTSHLRLVAKIAMGYRGYGLPLSELISEGNVGMMQAVKRFDPDRGFRLATYAMWWIRAAIQEYILHSWSLVKMGTTAAQKKLFFNLRKLKGQLQAIEEGDLSPENLKKIATELDVPEADVVSMNRRLASPDHSLNAPLQQRRRRRMAGLAGRREREPGDQARRASGARLAPRPARKGDDPSQRPRAPHPDRAAAEGQPDDARGSVAAIRHLARARAPDRSARLREAAKGDQGRRDRTPPRHPLSFCGRSSAQGHEGAPPPTSVPIRLPPSQTPPTQPPGWRFRPAGDRPSIFCPPDARAACQWALITRPILR